MANNLQQVSNLIATSMTEFFEQDSSLYNTSNHQFAEQFDGRSYATGGTINVKQPAYPDVQRGLSTTAQPLEDLVVPYTITENDIYSVVRELDLYEMQFNLVGKEKALTGTQKQAIVDNYAYPAYQVIQGEIEKECALRLKNTAFLCTVDEVGKLGSINTFSDISRVTTLMNELKFPRSDRVMMMNNEDAQAVADSLQNSFNTALNTKISRDALIGGTDKGRLAGLDMYASADLSVHEAGPLAGVSGITVSSISSDGTQITFAGVPSVSSRLVKAGDLISIPSVNLIDKPTKVKRNFKLVVCAAQDADGNGSGNVTVTLSFPLLASGEHANVDALPANGAPANVYPDHKVNYAYVMSGISTVPLKLGDIYGAVNSDVNKPDQMQMKVGMQGALREYSNIFRISTMLGIKVFAPYVIAIPSAA